MTQNNLPGTGSKVMMQLPPENDSSSEAVFVGRVNLNNQPLYNAGVVPELIIGSPKAGNLGTEAKVKAAFEPPPGTPVLGETQYQPLGSGADVAAYQPVTPKARSAGYHWETLAPTPPVTKPTIPKPITPKLVVLPKPPVAKTSVNSPLAGTVVPKKIVSKKLVSMPNPLGGKVISEEEIRPVMMSVLAIVFHLTALAYALLAFLTLGIVYWLNMAAAGNSPNGLFNLFLKSFPSFSALPVVLVLGAIGFLIAGDKIRDGSRKAWWMAIISVIGYPILTAVTAKSVWPIVESFVNNPQLNNYFNNLNGLDIRQLTGVFTGQLGVMALGGMLLILTTKFRYKTTKMSGSRWGLLVGLSLLIALPNLSYLGYNLFMGMDKDLRFTATKQAVGFKLYKPMKLPLGWEQVAYFGVNQAAGSLLVGRDDFVEASFNRDIRSRVAGKAAAVITVRQVDVPGTFDLRAFSNTVMEEATVRQIYVQRGLNNQGYMVEKLGTTGMVRALALVTSDQILILLSSKDASEMEMVDLANSLN